MKRRLFNFAAVTSLFFLLASSVMWVRSGWVEDGIEFGCGESHVVFLDSRGGELCLSEAAVALQPQRLCYSFSFPSGLAWRWPRYGSWTTAARPGSVRNGPEWSAYAPGNAGRVFAMRQLVLPYWLLTLSGGCLPAIWLWMWWREKRERRRGGFAVESGTTKDAR